MSSETPQPHPMADLSFRDLEEQMLGRIRAVAAQHESVAMQLRNREAELDERRRSVEASHAKLSELAGRLANEREQLEVRAGDIEATRRDALTRAERAEATCAIASSERDELKRQLERAVTEADSSLRAITAQCDLLRSERDHISARLDDMIAEFARGGAESSERLRIILEQSAAETDRLRRGFEVTLSASETRRILAERRLADVMNERDALRQRLIESAGQTTTPCAPEPSASTMPAWLASRPRRLKNIREALHRRALELRAIRDALSRREIELETRNNLSLCRTDEAPQPQTRSQSSRNFAKTAGVAMIVASLGGASWLLSGIFGSQSFEAHATLGVHPKDRPLSLEELAQWNIVHRELLTDPLFHEAAAARFRNIGEFELGDAPRVSKFISVAMTAESSHAGELILRLRDTSPEDAERRLESIASALTCYVNGAADLRLQSATTKITANPVVDETPVFSDRSNWAWRCFALALSVFALPLGWLFSRSAAVKSPKIHRFVPVEESERRAA